MLKDGRTHNFVPLDVATKRGHAQVVRDLIQRFGLAGCRGESGGAESLRLAAQNGHEAIHVTNAGERRRVARVSPSLFRRSGARGNYCVKRLRSSTQRRKLPVIALIYVGLRDCLGGNAFHCVAFGRVALPPLCGYSSMMPVRAQQWLRRTNKNGVSRRVRRHAVGSYDPLHRGQDDARRERRHRGTATQAGSYPLSVGCS